MEPVLLHGHAAHVLDGDRAEWLVEAGKANVFCVRVENGQPVGSRRYVLTGQPGDVLLGSTAPGSANGYRFLSVGSEDCRLRRLSATELTQPLEDVDARGIDQVARWVEKLTNLLAADMPGEAPVNTGAADQMVLSPGQIFRSPQRAVCWLKVEEGSLAFMGIADLVVGPEAPLFPAGSEAWFRAETQTRVVLRKPAEFAESADLTRGLAQFHGLIFAFLKHKEAQEIKEDLTRLRERRQFEDRETDRAIRQIVSIVTPLEEAPVVRSDLLQALAVIGRQLKVAFAPPAKSEDLSRVPDPLEAIARASRVRLRHIQLRGKWWQADCGPLLCYIVEDNNEFPVALVRSKWGAYDIFDPRDGIFKPVDGSVLSKLSARAVMFYQAFPARPLTLVDLPLFAFQLFRRELALILVLSLTMTILGMLLPQAMRWIMDYALPDADRGLLLELGVILIAVMCGKAVLLLAEGFVTLRLMTGTTATLQAATWDRLLRLAPQFFRRFASGDLLNRSMMITDVSHALAGSALRSLVTGCLALFNLFLLFYYSAKMAAVAIVVALANALASTLLSVAIRKRALLMVQLDGRLFGFMVQIINGIAKLRVAGAERRAYSHWAKRFAERLRLVASVQRLEDFGSIVNVVISPLATMAIFTLAAGMLAQTTLTIGYFLAFFTAFGIFAGGVATVSHALVDIMDSLAKQKLMQPILEAQPEFDAGRADPGRLTGNVFLDKIVFRYQPHSPLILNGVSVTAHTGEFIALVGPSGSGKSTLLRLLLGFELPESGGVYYDGKNLNGLDLTAVRRQLGIVLQSARISAGSIFDNIACGNIIRLEECWQAIRDAGMEEDVANMPMGIHTIVSEGGGNMSGGQRQRLLIARALVLNPKILMFDEATSALDNATQAIVTQSLKRRQVTRIVVAHRLSTIQDADRIYVLEKGQVRQAGRFDELSKQEGLFQRMMARQMA